MMVRLRIAAGLVAAVGWIGGATAQTSLFDQKPAGGAAPALESPAPAAAPKRAKAKPRGPVPARTLAVQNASGSALVGLAVAADGKEASLGKPVADGGSATLKLPALKSCRVTITATFEGATEPEQMEQDICKDKKLRLTNGGAT